MPCGQQFCGNAIEEEHSLPPFIFHQPGHARCRPRARTAALGKRAARMNRYPYCPKSRIPPRRRGVGHGGPPTIPKPYAPGCVQPARPRPPDHAAPESIIRFTAPASKVRAFAFRSKGAAVDHLVCVNRAASSGLVMSGLPPLRCPKVRHRRLLISDPYQALGRKCFHDARIEWTRPRAALRSNTKPGLCSGTLPA